MRILIGHDNCECSEAAVKDLWYAGFGDGPSKDVEARVVGAARVSGVLDDEAYVQRIPHVAEIIAEREQPRIDAATVAARAGAELLHELKPNWKISSEVVCTRSIHGALTETVERWPADLLVVGSHGRGAVSRLVHGSVAQMCVNHCRQCVRVARRPSPEDVGPHTGSANRPVKLVVAVDGSADSAAAVREVARRHWPRQSHSTVIHVLEPAGCRSIREKSRTC